MKSSFDVKDGEEGSGREKGQNGKLNRAIAQADLQDEKEGIDEMEDTEDAEVVVTALMHRVIHPSPQKKRRSRTARHESACRNQNVAQQPPKNTVINAHKYTNPRVIPNANSSAESISVISMKKQTS